jgi:hypothetical protein|uniref:Hedgehog/Intein (Hint) domain-containing protein n=1 Tax=viral metagenome TaxID=1070528 RepID=A0A6C0INN9_9ZZZZ
MVTVTVSNIEYPSSTSNVTVKFLNAITDVEINSFITNEPSSGSTLSTMTTSDGGLTWTGILTGTPEYVVKDATMSINYTGGISASDSYNIIMTEDGKGWNDIFSITDGVNSYTGFFGISCNKSGTIFAFDCDQENNNAENKLYPRVKVYEYDGTNWNQKGVDLAVSTLKKSVQHYSIMTKLNDLGDHIIINMAPTDGTIVYKWDGSSWVQKGSVFTHITGWYGLPEISGDGNTIGILTQVESFAWVYEYDTNTNDWVLKGNALDLTEFAGYGKGKISINNDNTVLSFMKGDNIYTYKWNNGSSLWELKDTLYIENLADTLGIQRNYGGNIIAFRDINMNNRGVHVYEWNGTELVQLGSRIEVDGQEVSLDETGTKIAISKFRNQLRNQQDGVQIYTYDGTNWNLSNTTIYEGKFVKINGVGDRVFMSNGFIDKSVLIQENSIVKKLNKMIMTPSAVKFPDSTSELILEYSHKDLTSTEVGTNLSISDVNLGSLGAFMSSEGGYVWKSIFTGAIIEGTGTIDYSYSGMTGSVSLVVDRLEKAISNICFYGDTKVLTSEGYKAIREVRKGMKIRGEYIEEVTRTISKEKEVILMKKGSLMPNMPNEDTRVTKEHKVLYKGQMIEVKELENGESIVKEKYKGETLYNILLSGEGKMIVNGMVVETLSPSNNIARLYKILKDYKEEEKVEIIRIYNEERKRKCGKCMKGGK